MILTITSGEKYQEQFIEILNQLEISYTTTKLPPSKNPADLTNFEISVTKEQCEKLISLSTLRGIGIQRCESVLNQFEKEEND